MASLQRLRLEAASAGYNVDDAPASIPKGKATLLQNYITGEQGRTRQRGPLTKAAQTYGANDKRLVGIVPGRDRMLLGFRKNNTSTRVIEPHVAPRADAASDGSTLASAAEGSTSSMQSLNLTGTPSASSNMGASVSRNAVPGWAWTRMGNFVYALAYDGDADSGTPIGYNDRGGGQRMTRMLRYDVRSPTTQPYGYTFHPFGAQDIRVHYNRLFFLGGRHPDTVGSFINTNCLWYTRTLSANHHDKGFSPNGLWNGYVLTSTCTFIASDYPNDCDNINPTLSDYTSSGDAGVDAAEFIGTGWPHRSPMFGEPDAGHVGVYNRIDLPWEEDYGVCFASIGRNLGIFKRRYVLLLRGFDLNSFELRTAITGTGCLDPRSVVEANEGAYFLSQQGFMFFDGVQLHDASPGVKRHILSAAVTAVGDEATPGGQAVAELLDRNTIMLTISQVPFNTNADPTTLFCGLYHIPSNSWTTFSSDTLDTSGGAPTWVARSENRLVLFDQTDARQAGYITTPDSATGAQRGRDYVDGSTGDKTIKTKWHSRLAELAAPFQRAKIHRIIIDYNWVKDGVSSTVDAEPFDGPTVTLYDGTGTALGGDSTWSLPYGIDDGREIPRQRHVHDCFVECTELQVRIEYTGTVTSLELCDIQDVWIEYEIINERHTTV